MLLCPLRSAARESLTWRAGPSGPHNRNILCAYLDHCCDPAYGRLVWLEGPAALGWHRWRGCERKYAYGLVERFTRDLVQFSFWMLGGAGLAVAEAAPPGKPRVRDEWGRLIGQAIRSLRIR